MSGPGWQSEGGRVDSTAAATLCLESCRESPDKRLLVAGSAKLAVEAIEKALCDADADVDVAARRALQSVGRTDHW